MTARIHWESNTVHIYGSPATQHAKFFSQAVFMLAEKEGRRDIVLDFTKSESLFQNFMVPLIAVCRLNIRNNNCEFDVKLPEASSLRSLFHNANWSYLIKGLAQITIQDAAQPIVLTAIIEPPGHCC